MKKYDPDNIAIGIISILYLVGIWGILSKVHADFILLTPVNLLVTLGLVLWRHPVWSRETVLFLLICYVVGFGAELFGVQTGVLFGEYTYGKVLGWKIWETPLMIGVNWMMLTYCSGVAVNRWAGRRLPWPVKAVLAAGLMVVLDVLIEPVAIHYGFWDWPGGAVPLKNFIGWFIVALPLMGLFMYWQGQVRNKVGVALFIWQFVFFLTLGTAT